MPSGYLLVNKPSGPTSHDVVQELRTISEISEIGHAGTLDPLAEGLLIILVGSFTKKSKEFTQLPKEYQTTLRLGLESDSHDIAGQVDFKKEYAIPSREEIESALEKFRGKIKQVPPQFSAVKKGGRKAYQEARAGREMELAPREVFITKLETVWYKFPLLTLYLVCSSGTYVRALARDLGKILGTGAVVVSLRRLAIGPYRLTAAVDLAEISSENFQRLLKTG